MKKNTVIIGAGKGIGLKTCQLLSDSDTIYALSRTITSEMENTGANCYAFDSNQDDYNLLENLPEVVDHLIFCPGSIVLKPFHRISQDEFQIDFEQNVLGAIKAIQFFLPRLKKSDEASIVLFSSVAAQTGMSFHSSVSLSKGAVEGLTRALAAEFAPTIRVNCIAPSLTLTSLSEKLTNSEEKIENANQRHPLKRIGTVEDLAEMVCFLSSYKSSWITGQIFHVDGGMSSLK